MEAKKNVTEYEKGAEAQTSEIHGKNYNGELFHRSMADVDTVLDIQVQA